ncbi:TonB-dependent receptor domain-containing protein [Ferrimonas aestuarii]|uniref:TonB-dependent receptor n=1 Tax=Ferrimonas aestuarii TaxID=2569539 RepID=A0A4U1BR74_9GAMM|nr:TonB-dependent receptor [Ferrimonas aestuarii]TKB54220.1 TonB-dependent receptor [Ferrimonas aestuarii]
MSIKTRLAVAIAAAIPTLSNSAFASTSVDEVIVVTPNRMPLSIEQSLSVVHLIERDQIEQMNPKSVVDLLETLPGVSVTRNGGPAQSASVSIRGSSSDHVLLLIDGVRTGSATLGSASFSALSPEMIERIEVVNGPRAALWGSDAIGGVIQIFTRRLTSGQGVVTGEIGSDSYARGSGALGLAHGAGQSSVSLSWEQSDGFDVRRDGEADDDGYERLGVGLVGEQPLSAQWRAFWVGQLSQGDYDYDNSAPYANRADYSNHLWQLGLDYQGSEQYSELKFGQMRDSNRNFRDGVAGKSLYETRRDQVSWQHGFQTGNLDVTGGLDYTKESVAGSYEQDERDIWAAYLAGRYEHERWTAEAALRFDEVESLDNETSYQLSTAYNFTSSWQLALGYATGFKVPTFNDLYWPNLGNPALQAETSENWELTLSYQGDNLSAYISGFDNEVDNLIDWAKTGEKDEFGWDIYKPSNVHRADLQGVELGAEIGFWGLEHQLAYTYLNAEDHQGNELEGRSEHQLDYGVSYRVDQLDLRMDYRYQGKRSEGDTNFDGQTDYLAPYHNLDLSVGYQLHTHWQLRLKLNNLLDEELISNGNYLGPDTQWFVSLSYRNF